MLVAMGQGISTCPMMMFNESELKQALDIIPNYDVGIVLAMGYPDENSVAEVATDSVEYWVDSQGVRHVPKRKLEDITHLNKFSRRPGNAAIP